MFRFKFNILAKKLQAFDFGKRKFFLAPEVGVNFIVYWTIVYLTFNAIIFAITY